MSKLLSLFTIFTAVASLLGSVFGSAMAGSLMLVNPAKRRRKATKKAPARRRSVSAKRTPAKRKYRRNPIGKTTGKSLIEQVKNAAIGAAGAVGVDLVIARIPQLAAQSGAMKSAAQGAVSLGLGMLVAKFGKNKKLGIQLAEGGLTVALHGVMKGAAAKALPNSGLSGSLLGYEDLSGDLLGYEYEDSTVGWYSPAPVSDSANIDGFEQF